MTRTLYIGTLPSTIGYQQLNSVLELVAPVTSLTIKPRRDHAFAFASFSDVDAQAALQFDNFLLCGHLVKVKEDHSQLSDTSTGHNSSKPLYIYPGEIRIYSNTDLNESDIMEFLSATAGPVESILNCPDKNFAFARLQN